MRARRQNMPVQSHTVARIGGQLDHQLLHQQLFNAAMSSPHLQQSLMTGTGTTTVGVQQQQQQQQQLQQPSDLASTVDLTGTPIDYLTPPPSNADFAFQNFQSTVTIDPNTAIRGEQHIQQLHQLQQSSSNSASVQQAPAPPTIQGQLTPLASPSTIHITSPFTPNNGVGGFSPSVQAQSSPVSLVQSSSPSNQVNTLTFAGNSQPPPLEQFTPYTPTLAHEPNQHQQQQNGVGRWELGFDANAILTPPFAIGSEQSGGQSSYQQDFGQEAASSVRNNKQYLGGGAFFGGGGGGSFDSTTTATNHNKFTPLDAVVRSSPSNNNNNNNVYWGTPKTAQQQLLRPPSPSFAEPNALRFNNNNNNNNHHHHHHHHLHHNNHNNHHHHSQFADAFQMPFTGQFDGPLSQGTVADHVVHSSFRIKRQLRDNDDNNNDKRPPSEPPKEAESKHDDIYSFDDQKPVYSFVKTDRNGNFKWSVRQGYY